ncbi:putative aldo keto reductase [Rosellinia necatrix]|uniref:Putative aldo keto reductase n=1 Tax=Rosellinia necatrix TaxID=77044 RepID=A0A1W2TFM8_ROSNE|nr:putative aldo keto reductase [Rosellinia necatrix]
MSLLRALPTAFVLTIVFYIAAILCWSVVTGPPLRTERHDTGIAIPSIGIGTWLSERDAVAHAVEFALKSGYNHIDAASIYGSSFRFRETGYWELTSGLENEVETGEGIRAANVPRDKIWVTSKLWNAHHRPSEAKLAVQKSIQDLGVDYLDLYLIHWPVAFIPGEGTEVDKSTTLTDTWRVMEDMVHTNLTRKIGISNFSRHNVETIMAHCRICPYAHEFETHPYLQQQEFVEYHKKIGVKVIAYSPLGNTNPVYGTKRKIKPILEDPFWTELAGKKNATVAQAILAWGLQRDTIVIPKSIHEKHIIENIETLDIGFTRREMQGIAEQDKKVRMNNPGREWGVRLFADLDDPTRLDGEDNEEL